MIGSVMGRVLGEPVSSVEVPSGVSVRRLAWIPALAGRLLRLDGPAAAVTLGRVIVVHPATRLTPRLLRHELAHVRQWRHRPASFPVSYVWHHFRHGYRDNPYEVEARAAEQHADRRP
jgi:hypothetical protein